MVTAITLALALAYEPAEPDLMRRRPRDPRAPLVSRGTLLWVAYVSVLIAAPTMAVFYLGQSWGWSTAQAQTMAVTMLALGQMAYLFSARSLRESSLRREMLTGNRVVWIVIAIMLVLQVAFVYLPFMNTLFRSAPLDWAGWALPLALSIAVFLLAEAGKALRRRSARPRATAEDPGAPDPAAEDAAAAMP